MKRLLPFVPLLILAALLLSPASALDGAKQGIGIWWGHVFPALLPSFICVKLAQQLGLLQIASRYPRGKLAAVIGFSLLSGAPNGAKLLGALVQDGSLSQREGERLLPCINSVSPVFLLSIIASELMENKALFLPIAVAFYGCILCFVVPRLLQKRGASPSPYAVGTKRPSFSKALALAIENGMLDMLRIGGCIVFACTLLSLLHTILPDKTVYAAAAGLMEVSTGVSTIAALSLPLRLKASLLTGCAAFGGLSLAVQTMCCYADLRVILYLLKKLLLGVLAGVVCYLIFPLFPNVSPVFASRQEVITRSLSVCALLLSSAVSVAFIGVLSLMIRSAERE